MQADVNAWNVRDLERVLSHCTDEFEMSSPLIAQLLRVSTGVPKGKTVIGVYWRKALASLPDSRSSSFPC